MSEENQTGNDDVKESELDSLKRIADQMGIKYHPNIGVDKLKEKVNEARSEPEANAPDPARQEPLPDEDNDDVPAPKKNETEAQRRQRILKEATKLVRVRITCMNPMKSEWQGEIFTTGNKAVGTIKKYVPFEAEWHVPQMILNMIEERKYQMFYTVRDKRTGNSGRKGKMVKEFAIEKLPALTEDELHKLKQRQLMAQGNNED